MTEEEAYESGKRIVLQLEEMVFKRYTHSKRGQGFTLIPKKRYRDLEELKDFFTYLFL